MMPLLSNPPVTGPKEIDRNRRAYGPGAQIIAKYPSVCQACGTNIEPGERVTWARHNYGVIHVYRVECIQAWEAQEKHHAAYLAQVAADEIITRKHWQKLGYRSTTT